jgi:hypothetical protein
MAVSRFASSHPWQLALLGLLAAGWLTGCGTAPTFTPSPDSASSVDASGRGTLSAEVAQHDFAADAAAPESANSVAPGAADLAKPAPQLVKRAELKLVLSSVDEGITAVTQLAQQLQGDLLGLQDWHPQQTNVPRQVSLTLRVPQQSFEVALDQIRQLGDIQQQSVTAEDVSDQLVDLEARLRNLRQSEAALLEIMDRSGKISEVLEVSRELSTVRESIERLAAQQQQLSRQVSYSTITLTLTSAVATAPNARPLEETLGSTWQAAAQSVSGFTVDLLKLSLWLLAYSPYWAVVIILALIGYRWQQRPRQPSREDPAVESAGQ